MMIFKLNNDFSKKDLQKSYKTLVKKYHPDSNPKNQDWSHKKMTEINLAYETCCNLLNNKTNITNDFKEDEVKYQEKSHEFNKKNSETSTINNLKSKHKDISLILYKKIKESSNNIMYAAEKFFEYGLENRKLRYEGVRRFRYRESLRLYGESFSEILQLETYCQNESDIYFLNLFIRFTGNFYQYIKLKENEIPHHPLLNRHWQIMEDYLINALKDYLVPHQMANSKKLHWKTGFTHCWNQIVYIRQRFPTLEKNDVFLIFHNLADSYTIIRKAEQDRGIFYFQPY